jgi:hypothetical protein
MLFVASALLIKVHLPLESFGSSFCHKPSIMDPEKIANQDEEKGKVAKGARLLRTRRRIV